jgi:hypothetical protein
VIKTLFVGIWACLVTLAASYEAASLMQARANRPVVVVAGPSEPRRSKEINVPVIRDGVVKGYVVVQLSYVVDLVVARTLPVPPEAIFADETFRFIYDDERIDFTHLDKIQLSKLTSNIMKNVNARMKADVITDVGVIECTFLLNAEAKPKM